MAARRPIVVVNGRLKELPQSDNVLGAAWGSITGDVSDQLDVQPTDSPVFREKLTVEDENPDGIELVVRVTGLNAPVLHYEYRNSSNPSGYPTAGQLIGAAGAKPWNGSGWAEHSTAAYHFSASEDHTATAQGTHVNIAATPVGKTNADRVVAGTFSGDGDFINSFGLTHRMVNPNERGRGLQVFRQANAEISVASAQNAAFSAFYRGVVFGGTPSAPSATVNGSGVGFGLVGYDGASFTGAKAIVGTLAAGNWTPTSNPAAVVVETTASGSTTRVRRWYWDANGNYAPQADNAYAVGGPSNRISQLYSSTATINTSDARLKTEPRQLRDAEFKAASAIARLPAVWRWLNRVHGDENCEPEGREARKHFGPTVQAAIAVMEAHGLDPFAYSFICYDEWEALPEQWHEWEAKEAVLDDDGNEIEPAVEAGRELVQEAREAGDRYSFRKEELLCFIVRALAHEIDSLSERVSALEAGQKIAD